MGSAISSQQVLHNVAHCEDESVDRQIAACSGGGAPKTATRLRAVEDPAFNSTPSRDWKAEIQKIRQTVEDPKVSDEEKIRILHEALQQRIDDTRAQEEVKASVQQRFETLQTERERCDAEARGAGSTASGHRDRAPLGPGQRGSDGVLSRAKRPNEQLGKGRTSPPVIAMEMWSSSGWDQGFTAAGHRHL
eukprot:Skav207126  [mRNA]  locus=scaffold554:545:7404:+ [translate_table: standard]